MLNFLRHLAVIHRTLIAFGLAGFITACTPAAQQAIVEVQSIPSQSTPNIVFVTPTREPSPIPTITIPTATLEATDTPVPVPTLDMGQRHQVCTQVLASLYEDASELCLGAPEGFFCNGGLPPITEPGGSLASSLAVPGALVEAQRFDSVRTPPLLANNSGGLMWLHLLAEIRMNGLMVGDVELRDVTPRDGSFPRWQSVTVRTTHSDVDCNTVPYSTFVVQGPYGLFTRLVINGTSIALEGTLLVQTHGNTTAFMVIEGDATIIVLGRDYLLYAGQQIIVPYNPDNFTIPATVPVGVEPLNPVWTAGLPVQILDRPVELPQPGYALTSGRVNMRAAPGTSERLLYQVPSDSVLSILGTNPDRDWYHIRLGNGETGWMRADLLTVNTGAISAVYNATPIPPQRFGDLGRVAQVVAPGGGNLRTAPDTYFPVITTLPPGTQVALLARSPYSPWVKVDAGGQIGWLALITIETRAAVAFLSVDYDASLPPRPTAQPVFDFGGGHAYPDPRMGQ